MKSLIPELRSSMYQAMYFSRGRTHLRLLLRSFGVAIDQEGVAEFLRVNGRLPASGLTFIDIEKHIPAWMKEAEDYAWSIPLVADIPALKPTLPLSFQVPPQLSSAVAALEEILRRRGEALESHIPPETSKGKSLFKDLIYRLLKSEMRGSASDYRIWDNRHTEAKCALSAMKDMVGQVTLKLADELPQKCQKVLEENQDFLAEATQKLKELQTQADAMGKTHEQQINAKKVEAQTLTRDAELTRQGVVILREMCIANDAAAKEIVKRERIIQSEANEIRQQPVIVKRWQLLEAEQDAKLKNFQMRALVQSLDDYFCVAIKREVHAEKMKIAINIVQNKFSMMTEDQNEEILDEPSLSSCG
eukprot:GEMP01051350.1.p1 GENE.GEMP01051350.1~~GEMP01051350.1.p1  ORF type:complete len:361 (+),score=73.46 GEMP01051350.1:201-1283(+)